MSAEIEEIERIELAINNETDLVELEAMKQKVDSLRGALETRIRAIEAQG